MSDKKFKIPEKVKIGPFIYDVLRVDRNDSDFPKGDGGKIACVDFKLNRIKIQCDISDQAAWESLWHEIVHVLDVHCDTDLSERDVSRLSYALCGVLVDNVNQLFMKEEQGD
jgi:hypothetical protein